MTTLEISIRRLKDKKIRQGQLMDSLAVALKQEASIAEDVKNREERVVREEETLADRDKAIKSNEEDSGIREGLRDQAERGAELNEMKKAYDERKDIAEGESKIIRDIREALKLITEIQGIIERQMIYLKDMEGWIEGDENRHLTEIDNKFKLFMHEEGRVKELSETLGRYEGMIENIVGKMFGEIRDVDEHVNRREDAEKRRLVALRARRRELAYE